MKSDRLITQLQNKFIEYAVENLSHQMMYKKMNYFVYDIHHFLLALGRREINSRTRNVVLLFNNELEVFILQSLCDVSFFALDVRSLDIFNFFNGGKVFKKVKPFEKKEDSARMRVFILILRGWDDERICNSLFITLKKLKEYKSQLSYLFFEKRRNLFYLTLNGVIHRDTLAA